MNPLQISTTASGHEKMNTLFASAILLTIQHIHGSFHYYYEQPLAQTPFLHQFPITQYYIQPHYIVPNEEVEIVAKSNSQAKNTSFDLETKSGNEEKFLGFGYRTQHENGHSNVVFVHSPNLSQLGLSSAAEHSKDVENNFTTISRTIASDMVDPNGENHQIQFIKEDQQPLTSLYTFYTLNNQVLPRNIYQTQTFSNPNLFNSRILELFSRFGFNEQTRDKDANETETTTFETRSKNLELNNSTMINGTEKVSKSVELTTETTSQISLVQSTERYETNTTKPSHSELDQTTINDVDFNNETTTNKDTLETFA